MPDVERAGGNCDTILAETLDGLCPHAREGPTGPTKRGDGWVKAEGSGCASSGAESTALAKARTRLHRACWCGLNPHRAYERPEYRSIDAQAIPPQLCRRQAPSWRSADHTQCRRARPVPASIAGSPAPLAPAPKPTRRPDAVLRQRHAAARDEGHGVSRPRLRPRYRVAAGAEGSGPTDSRASLT